MTDCKHENNEEIGLYGQTLNSIFFLIQIEKINEDSKIQVSEIY